MKTGILSRESDALRTLGFAKRKKKSELRSALRQMLATAIHFPAECGRSEWPYRRIVE